MQLRYRFKSIVAKKRSQDSICYVKVAKNYLLLPIFIDSPSLSSNSWLETIVKCTVILANNVSNEILILAKLKAAAASDREIFNTK